MNNLHNGISSVDPLLKRNKLMINSDHILAPFKGFLILLKECKLIPISSPSPFIFLLYMSYYLKKNQRQYYNG